MALEYIPGNSILHRMDPRTKIILFMAVVVLTVIIYDPFLIGLMLIVTLLLYKLAKIPFEKLTVVSKPLIPAFLMFVILNYFVSPPAGATIYFYLIPPNTAPVTLETTMIGVSSGLRFALFILITRLLTLVTPISDLLVALVKLKFPVEAAVSLGIAFASVPLMINQFRTVIEAQKSRGAKFEIRNPFKKMTAYIPIIVPSIYLTILRGMDISRTIESRAFTYNPAKRTFRKELILKGLDYTTIVASVIFLIPLVYLRIVYDWFGYMYGYNIINNTVMPYLWPYIQQILQFLHL